MMFISDRVSWLELKNTSVGIITATPVVRGSIEDVYLYEKGSGYGSNILNHQITPDIEILSGEGAEFKPIIVNGQIENVIVVNQGKNYNSIPDLEILNTGGGAGGAGQGAPNGATGGSGIVVIRYIFQ